MTTSVSLNANSGYTQELIKKAQNGDNDAVNELCSGLYNATAGKLGTDENYVNYLMQNADSKTLASIMDNYSNVTGSEIYKDIENDYSGKTEQEILAKLNEAYKEVNNEEYTGWNDGKLTIGQTAKSIGKGLLNKLPSIGLLAAGTYFAPAIAGAIGTGLSALVGATAATTIATVGAPILAAIGVATAGYMIYKGATETKEAIEIAQNSGSDEVTEQAVTQGTEGVIDTAEGIYLGVQSAKGLYDSVKNLKSATAKAPETTSEVTSETPTEVVTETVEPAQAKIKTEINGATTNLEDIANNSSILTKKEYETLVKLNPDKGAHSSLYISESNKVIQHYLRTGENITSDCGIDYTLDEISESICAADKVFNVSKLPKNTILYRYVNDLSYIPEAGEAFTDSGYFATSIREGLSRDFGNRLITVYAPEGTSCIANGNRFAEVILNKGNTFETLYKDTMLAVLLLK